MKISFSILTALSFLYCFASFLTASSAYGGEVAVEMEERMVAEERAASGEHLDPSASTKKVPRVEAENMAHETTPSTIPEVQADSIDKMASSDGSGEVQLQNIEEHAKPEEEMMSDEEKEKYCESEGQEFQGRRRRRLAGGNTPWYRHRWYKPSVAKKMYNRWTGQEVPRAEPASGTSGLRAFLPQPPRQPEPYRPAYMPDGRPNVITNTNRMWRSYNDQEQAVYQNQRARMFIEDPRMRDVMQQERDFRARKAKWGRLGWMCKPTKAHKTSMDQAFRPPAPREQPSVVRARENAALRQKILKKMGIGAGVLAAGGAAYTGAALGLGSWNPVDWGTKNGTV